jgi:hypothetical protein
MDADVTRRTRILARTGPLRAELTGATDSNIMRARAVANMSVSPTMTSLSGITCLLSFGRRGSATLRSELSRPLRSSSVIRSVGRRLPIKLTGHLETFASVYDIELIDPDVGRLESDFCELTCALVPCLLSRRSASSATSMASISKVPILALGFERRYMVAPISEVSRRRTAHCSCGSLRVETVGKPLIVVSCVREECQRGTRRAGGAEGHVLQTKGSRGDVCPLPSPSI